MGQHRSKLRNTSDTSVWGASRRQRSMPLGMEIPASWGVLLLEGHVWSQQVVIRMWALERYCPSSNPELVLFCFYLRKLTSLKFIVHTVERGIVITTFEVVVKNIIKLWVENI